MDNLINKDGIIKPPVNYQPRGSLGQEFFRLMRMHRSKVAQYLAETGEEETYGNLLIRCIRCALEMRQRGITPDDIVCLCTYNHANSCVPFIASTFLGVKVASLDPTLSEVDVTHLLKQVQPAVIFLTPESEALIEVSLKNAELQSDLVVFGPSNKYDTFSEYLKEHEEEKMFQPVPVPVMDTAVIFFSSGTTGLPKGICQNSYALLCQGNTMIYSGNDCGAALYYASLYWISSVLFLISTALAGGARIVCKSFDPSKCWKLLSRYKATTLFLAPSQAITLCKVGRPDGIDTTNLLCLVTGGGKMSEKFLLELRDYLPGTFVTQAYGQTEVAGLLSCFNFNEVKDTLLLHHKTESCGRPCPGIWYKVVDPDTQNIQGPNELGELIVKTKYVMNGYYNMDSSDCLDSDGWLRTGDITYFDEDQCLYVVDRIKEMLKYRGDHVQPAVIERILQDHPAVKTSVVIGRPHEEDGEHPMAVILLEPNTKDVTEEDIIEYVAERVSDKNKLRGGVKFVDKLPLTPSGKVKRQLLKKMVFGGA